MNKETFAEWIESEEFDSIAYSYRSWSRSNPEGVMSRFRELKAAIKQKAEQALALRGEPVAWPFGDDCQRMKEAVYRMNLVPRGEIIPLEIQAIALAWLKAYDAPISGEREEFEQAKRVAQVCYDLHEALGIKWGDDPYAAIRALRSSGDPTAWMFTNEEGDDDFGNNYIALKDKTYNGGPIVPLYTGSRAAVSGERVREALQSELATAKQNLTNSQFFSGRQIACIEVNVLSRVLEATALPLAAQPTGEKK